VLAGGWNAPPGAHGGACALDALKPLPETRLYRLPETALERRIGISPRVKLVRLRRARLGLRACGAWKQRRRQDHRHR